MNLNEYQEKAMTTCTPTSNNFSYMFLNLVGELGEFASKVAKHIRKDKAYIEDNKLYSNQNNITTAEWKELKLELGDCLWQLSGLCSVMGWSMEDIAEMNLVKLAERKKNGTIVGNGDGVRKEDRL